MVSAVGWVFIAIAIALLLALIALIVYANLPTKYTLGGQVADYEYLSAAPLTKLEGWTEGAGQEAIIPVSFLSLGFLARRLTISSSHIVLFKASSLWRDSGVLLMAVRRPG